MMALQPWHLLVLLVLVFPVVLVVLLVVAMAGRAAGSTRRLRAAGSAPANWYPDPYSPPGQQLLRYWDGVAWTGHTSPPPPS